MGLLPRRLRAGDTSTLDSTPASFFTLPGQKTAYRTPYGGSVARPSVRAWRSDQVREPDSWSDKCPAACFPRRDLRACYAMPRFATRSQVWAQISAGARSTGATSAAKSVNV